MPRILVFLVQIVLSSHALANEGCPESFFDFGSLEQRLTETMAIIDQSAPGTTPIEFYSPRIQKKSRAIQDRLFELHTWLDQDPSQVKEGLRIKRWLATLEELSLFVRFAAVHRARHSTPALIDYLLTAGSYAIELTRILEDMQHRREIFSVMTPVQRRELLTTIESFEGSTQYIIQRATLSAQMATKGFNEIPKKVELVEDISRGLRRRSTIVKELILESGPVEVSEQSTD